MTASDVVRICCCRMTPDGSEVALVNRLCPTHGDHAHNFEPARLSEHDFVGIGLQLTRLTVDVLGLTDFDAFVDACREQFIKHGDDASEFALRSAEALQQFRNDLRRLTGVQVERHRARAV